METHTLAPSTRYRSKLIMVMTLIAILVMIAGLLLSWPIGRDEGPRGAWICILIFLLVDILWYVPGLILAGYYFRSLKYEIRDDEVIVNVGIWTKSIKHVPYRTVTNLKTNRDIFDRWFFGIGSLNIQTAGMSGSTGAEEALVGLPNVQEIYEMVSNRLRRYRGAMSPTGAEEEDGGKEGPWAEVLAELRGIRTALEK